MKRAALAAIACLSAHACSSDTGSYTYWSEIVDQGDGQTSVRWQEQGEVTRVEVTGEPLFDARGVTLIGFGEAGSLKVIAFPEGADEASGWTVELRADGAGISRTLRVGGLTREWTPADEERLAAILLRLTESTAVGALSRARALQAEGGLSAVVEAAAGLSSGTAAAVFLEHVLGQDPLDPALLSRVAAVAGQSTSQGAANRILSALVPRLPTERRLTIALLEATRGLASSSTRAGLLQEVARSRRLEPADIALGFELATEIPSGSSRTATLIELLATSPTLDGIRDPYLLAARTVPSSSDRGELLEALLARKDAGAATHLGILANLSEIPSSSTRAELLGKVLAAGDIKHQGFFEALLARIGELPSSSQRAELLVRLVDHPDLDRARATELGPVLADLPGSTRRAELQARLIERLTRD